MKMKSVLTALVVIMVCSASTEGVTAEQKDTAAIVRPCVTITGADSKVSERSYHRITTAEDWTRVWQKHKGQKEGEEYDLYYNPLGLPVVDFDRYMVLGIFQGSTSNCAGLNAVSVSDEQDRIVIRFENKSYQTRGGGKLVTVYGFFVVPRSAKSVILEENVSGLIGGPPVWKERITFPKL